MHCAWSVGSGSGTAFLPNVGRDNKLGTFWIQYVYVSIGQKTYFGEYKRAAPFHRKCRTNIRESCEYSWPAVFIVLQPLFSSFMRWDLHNNRAGPLCNEQRQLRFEQRPSQRAYWRAVGVVWLTGSIAILTVTGFQLLKPPGDSFSWLR